MLTGSLILISATLVQQSLSTSMIDCQLLYDNGFSRLGPISRFDEDDFERIMMDLSRRSDHAGMSFSITKAKGSDRRSKLLKIVNGNLTAGTIDGWAAGGPSGLPAGDKAHFSQPRSREGTHVLCLYQDIVVRAVITHSGRKLADGTFAWSGDDQDGDALLAEGVCRDALANAAGAELVAAPNSTVNGRTITSMRQDAQGVRYVPISDWGQAHGIDITMNRYHGSGAFTHGGKSFVIPLSADRIKVGAQWVSLGGFILRANGKWYAPLTGMESSLH